MNKLSILPLVVGMLLVTNASTQNAKMYAGHGYNIDGILYGLKDGTAIYLTRNNERGVGLDTISKALSKGKKFSFSGQLTPEQEGEAYFIYLDTLDMGYHQLRRQYLLLHLENSNIKVTGAIDNMDPFNIMVDGSRVHEDLMAFSVEEKKLFIDPYNNLWTPITNKVWQEITKDTTKSADVKKFMLDGITKAVYAMRNPDQRKAYRENWIRTHFKSLAAPLILSQEPFTDSLYRNLYDLFTPKVKNSFYGRKIKNILATNENLIIGKKAPELKFTDRYGKVISLGEVSKNSKVTIVDFWAYWCGPCRKSFPYLKKLYNAYHSKGLEIYGVSVDSRETPWLKALNEDSLPWLNVIANNKGTLDSLYSLTGVPMYYVLDHEGKIVMKFSGFNDIDKSNLQNLLRDKLGQSSMNVGEIERKRIMEESEERWKLQGTVTDKALKIGDMIPNITMDNMLNYSGGKARMSDFKGKLVILDFWSRGCKSCIGSFPKMEMLQAKFKDKLQILTVTPHSREAYSINEPNFPEKSTSPILRSTKLPMVFFNLALTESFPHYYQPYYVWIDRSGKVLAMTDSEWITEENIQAVLDNKTVPFEISLSYKALIDPENYFGFDREKSILEEGHGRYIPKVVYFRRSMVDPKNYVLIGKLGFSIRGGTRFGITKDGTEFKSLDMKSIESLFRYAFKMQSGGEHQAFIIQGAIPGKYYSVELPDETFESRIKSRTYSLEFSMPEDKNLIQNALLEYFDVDVKTEIRRMKCLILRRTSNLDKLSSKFSKISSSFEPSGTRSLLINTQFGKFIYHLKFYNEWLNANNSMPIIDETGISGDLKVDMDIKNIADINSLKLQLKKYDLELIEEEREVFVLVVKELK